MSLEYHAAEAQRDFDAICDERAKLVIGPGFPPPSVGVPIPPLCESGEHTFVPCGVCTTCRRTVPELALVGQSSPQPCSETGIHVVVGSVCIECRESVKVSA